MKITKILAALLFSFTLSLHAQDRQLADSLKTMIASKGIIGAAQELESALKADSNNDSAFRMLHLLLATPNTLSRSEGMRLREAIKQHAFKSTATLTPPDEPGDQLIISGIVRNAEGKPVAGARMFVFQTDAHGCYSPSDAATRRMDEPNSRLFGMMVTGADGRYEFRTVRPGGYPFPRKDIPQSDPLRFIPAHIHFEITAAGFSMRRFQLIFDDDPRMTPEWHSWATKENNPVVKATRDQNGIQHAVCDIFLQKN